MAPKKKNKSKREKQELEEEAMAEWLARGFNIKDFTMEKMLAIWLEEDGDDDGEEGEDTLSAKQDLIKGLSLLDPVIEQAKELAETIKDVVKEGAVHAIQTAWKYAEIPPLKSRRLLREHVAHVHEMDREANKYTIIRQRVRDEWESAQTAEKDLAFGLKKRNARKEPLLVRSREMTQEADREQHARLMADIETKRRDRMDHELAEKQRAREARDQFADTQRKYKRKMNMKFWQKQYVDAKKFASEHSLADNQKKIDQFTSKVTQMKEEIDEMSGDYHAEAEYAPRHVATASPGVFSTNFEPGEWHSSIDGGHREEMDAHAVDLFSARGFQPENELLRGELMDAQSKVAMLQEKMETLASVRANVLTDKKTILERKEKLLMDIKQVTVEQDELGQQLAGPPRRDPSEADKRHSHTLVTRRAALIKLVHDANARVANLDDRAELAERSAASLEQMLEKAVSVENELQRQVGHLDQHSTDLPVVIGRSILRGEGAAAARGDPQLDGFGGDADAADNRPMALPLPNPTQLYADVTMETKLRLLEEASVPVKDHFKKAKRLAMDDWKTKELKALGEQELEVTKNRLSTIRDRMIDHYKNSVRADLMQAILRFHQGSHTLRKCIFPLKGRFEWWQSHDPTRSSGLSYDNGQNVVFLPPTAHDGQLRGCVRLPKSALFQIKLSIKIWKRNASGQDDWALVLDNELAEPNEDDTDAPVDQATEQLTVFVGSDYDSLQEHVFHDQAGKPLRTGELKLEFYGSRLCFSFAMRHRGGRRPETSAYRVVVANGASFEERIHDFREEESRMRLIQKESHVVSELVKTMRMQSKKTSSERCADLLEELICVEKSRAQTWDSALFHGHQQRFKRLEYAKMLRAEIKKELAHQIDQDVQRRQGRLHVSHEHAVADPMLHSDEDQEQTDKNKRREQSSMAFLERKHELVEPQYRKATRSLGEYCSFKLPETGDIVDNNNRGAAYRKQALVMGLRLEWREGRTKLHVMHKLFGSSESDSLLVPEWCCVDSSNAVFLASACTKALHQKRQDASNDRAIAKQKAAQVSELRRETQATIALQQHAEMRHEIEDLMLENQKKTEIQRRKTIFYGDAMRNTTYNPHVKAQIEFLAQRKQKTLEETETEQHVRQLGQSASSTEVLQSVKHAYATEFVEGRLALVHKTWERKAKRIQDKRDSDTRERLFRIQQEQKLVHQVEEEETHQEPQNTKTKKDHLVSKIAHFHLAMQGVFPCEHRELKAWGAKYDCGLKCKQCGKEMSKSFDEIDHTRGADAELDRDIDHHRAQATGNGVAVALRLKHATHFENIEKERLRLEKEAREMELGEALLYDRMDGKAIEEFNFRHQMNRQVDVVEGNDPMYPRTVQDKHRAAFQDELLHHGRLKNFQFRIDQLTSLHAHTTTMIAVQRDFLERVQEENEFVLAKLPLVEKDHARAIRLVEEDEAAVREWKAARSTLDTTRKERNRAYYALEGVEEEAEFAEFHAPALIANSGEMETIVTRMKEQVMETTLQIEKAKILFEKAQEEKTKKCENLFSTLLCHDKGTRVRTKYGFCRVLFYRAIDDFVVVSPETWHATIFISVHDILSMEMMHRQEETALMAEEEKIMKQFISDERQKEVNEILQMENEDLQIHTLEKWQKQKIVDEQILKNEICDEELRFQFEYETTTEKRKLFFQEAEKEANKLSIFPLVSLTRKKRQRQRPIAAAAAAKKGQDQEASSSASSASSASIARPSPSKLMVLRVTRASEKRLAMDAMEKALLSRDKSLRGKFQKARDAVFVEELATKEYDLSLKTIVKQLRGESLEEQLYDAQQFHHAHNQGLAMLLSNGPEPKPEPSEVPVHVAIRLHALWVARRHKYGILHETWAKEYAKLQLLRVELARRENILRKEEQERQKLQKFRKEMLFEERLCRQFYLDELVFCMRERKSMANAELEMKEYERLLEAEAMKAKYAKMIDDRNKTNDKAARRLEIKIGKNEKHRLHREWAHMKEEDEFAIQLRNAWLSQVEKDALEKQFDKFLIQQAADGKLAQAREESAFQERIHEAKRLATEKQKQMEASRCQARMMATVEAFYLATRLEVQWMDAVERVLYWHKKGDLLQANLIPMESELKRILAEKDHVVADAAQKRTHADLCTKRAREADKSLSLAIENEQRALLQYQKVHFVNATMDSQVLHGRPQRFKTLYLRDQLHTKYFYLLTEYIVRKAIVECNERETQRLETKRLQIEQERTFKMNEIGVLKRKRRRNFRLQLKRSELGKLCFGLAQKRVLKERFFQWVKLWAQRVMVRASFDVKHGLLMQQNRLLAHKKTPQAKEEVDNTTLSILHRHQKRRVQCRLCQRQYTEEQNHRHACAYHPGAYELACVSTCPTRHGTTATGSTSAATCMVHRARRWLCCDATEEGRYGSNGCATRFHLAVRDNPALQELVANKEQQEETLLSQLQKQLDELKERNLLGKAAQATKATVTKIEQELVTKRATAAKYFSLDRR